MLYELGFEVAAVDGASGVQAGEQPLGARVGLRQPWPVSSVVWELFQKLGQSWRHEDWLCSDGQVGVLRDACHVSSGEVPGAEERRTVEEHQCASRSHIDRHRFISQALAQQVQALVLADEVYRPGGGFGATTRPFASPQLCSHLMKERISLRFAPPLVIHSSSCCCVNSLTDACSSSNQLKRSSAREACRRSSLFALAG